MDTQNIAIPKNSLFASIKSPEKTLFEGLVSGISSVNDKGPFDILPEHEQFISLIKEKIVVYPVKGSKLEWKVDKGVLKVKGNTVNVFLGIETF